VPRAGGEFELVALEALEQGQHVTISYSGARLLILLYDSPLRQLPGPGALRVKVCADLKDTGEGTVRV